VVADTVRKSNLDLSRMDESALLPFKARAHPPGRLFASTPMTKSQASASLDGGVPLFHLSDACQPTPQERAFWSRDLMVSIYHSCSTIPHAVQWLRACAGLQSGRTLAREAGSSLR
jgi:hypothetical protein